MKTVNLDILNSISLGGEFVIFDKEEYDENMFLNNKIFATTSKQTTINANVKEDFSIFYENEYNIFSRFDQLKQNYKNFIKVINIKDDSIIISHNGYQQFISIDGKEIQNPNNPFEIKIGKTLILRTNMHDCDKYYAIKVNSITEN